MLSTIEQFRLNKAVYNYKILLLLYAGDLVSLCDRSAETGSTPQTAAPCHQVCGEMLITSAEK